MNNEGKPESLTVSDKINILAQVDAHIGTHVEHASWLRLSVHTLNPIVKNHEEIERCFIQCGPFSEQHKLFKCVPLELLETAFAAQFKYMKVILL
jgi:hypothetical protein